MSPTYKIRAFCFLKKKVGITQGHKDFLLFFSSKFKVLALTFRFMIHFKLIFGHDARYESKFIFFFFIWMSNCSSTTCWKHHPFPFELYWDFCQKLINHLIGLLLSSLIYSLDLSWHWCCTPLINPFWTGIFHEPKIHCSPSLAEYLLWMRHWERLCLLQPCVVSITITVP